MRLFSEYLSSPIAKKAGTTGLFGVKGLTSPEGLTNFAENSLTKAQSIAQDLEAPYWSRKQLPGALEIRKLDELSDTLCKVVDMAAFLRISHPNNKMADAAQKVHELLFGFMNELNTSRRLFKLVVDALKNPDVKGEARRVGEILEHDFLKTGIQYDTDPKTQHRFIDLSNEISINGQQFLMGCGLPSKSDLILDPQDLAGVSPMLVTRLAASSLGKRGRISIPADQPHIAEHILATANNSSTRRKVWQYLRSAPDEQVTLLDSVLKDRQELAGMAGYGTFAEYELSDKMMHTPQNVNRFLTSLATTVTPFAKKELLQLGSPAKPWDYPFHLAKFRSQMRNISAQASFELPAVFAAIGKLVNRLYGLRLEPGEIQQGEVWAPEVKRLDIYDGPKKVAVIYCDLLSRPGKQPNPAHFTIQCSRKLGDGQYQFPIIALVCDFDKKPPQLLQFHEVQTLFHEMGHAIHSMIGRTDLHNVSGTRCATDFVELPSILFEKFASHPDVLEMMRPGIDASEFLRKQARIDKVSEYWEVSHQLSLSFLDQALHGIPFGELQSSQAVFNRVTSDHSLYSSQAGHQSRQFAHFGHLISYGATYYSYLFDKCLAAMTWELLFKESKNWEIGGEKLKEEVLKWGGAKDPQESIERLFGRSLDHSKVAASLALN